jgi:hypothetical protein
MSETRDGELPNGSPMDAPEDYVPFMERLTPSQRREFERKGEALSGRDCKHGHLARSCEVCELERERDGLRRNVEEALRVLEMGRDVDVSVAKQWLRNALAGQYSDEADQPKPAMVRCDHYGPEIHCIDCPHRMLHEALNHCNGTDSHCYASGKSVRCVPVEPEAT